MGLLAHQLEQAGIPTISLTSALDVTQAVKPPRAVFLNFPLGHTAGKPGDRALQLEILRQALALSAAMTEPGSIARLPFEWDDPQDPRWRMEWQVDLQYLEETGAAAAERVRQERGPQ